MAVNPMQKKARNSFLLGMIITFVVCAAIGGTIFVLTSNQNKKKQEEEGTLTYVYKLKTNVMSGSTITAANVEEVLVTTKAVPADAFPSRTEVKNEKGKSELKPQIFPAAANYKAKVNLNAGTVLTKSMLYTGEEITSDLRYVEYNMLSLSTTVDVGSYIDVRLTLPNGLDLIVISEKEVKSIIGNTIGLELTEDEILMMENAIVEAYIMTSSKLYATEYVEPGTQISEATGEAGTVATYVPIAEVQELILNHPNIVNEVKNDLIKKYNDNKGIREDEAKQINKYADEKLENVEEKLQEEIENARAAREAYLNGLTSY